MALKLVVNNDKTLEEVFEFYGILNPSDIIINIAKRWWLDRDSGVQPPPELVERIFKESSLTKEELKEKLLK